MDRDITFAQIYCEAEGCENNIGYAGCVIHNLKTDRRMIVCHPCRIKPQYREWLMEVCWR